MVIPCDETTAPKPGELSIGDRLELRWSTGREVDGLWIGTIESDAESIIRRVEDAISVSRLHDPRRYRRLCHDFSRIWVRLLPGDLANFNSAIRACQLDSRHVRDEAVSASELAASIVHEAAHARIDRCVPYREELRDRIEAACLRRELAFARQLPDNHGFVERMHNRLTSPLPARSGATLSSRSGASRVSSKLFAISAFLECCCPSFVQHIGSRPRFAAAASGLTIAWSRRTQRGGP